MVAQNADNESERLANLFSHELLDTPEDDELNQIVQLAAEITEMPISLVSLIDENRQWFKAKVGLELNETPREYAFCDHTIKGKDLFTVQDATLDDRFMKNPLVTGDPNIRFYAGVPLETTEGYQLGTLCVIDRKPGVLTSKQEKALHILAKQVVINFELRKKNRSFERALDIVDAQKRQLESKNLILSRLLSIISHDLRNPIENLKQIFGLFASGDISTEDMKFMSVDVNKSLASTSDMLNNILSWAERQLSDIGIKIVAVNLYELVEEQLTIVGLAANYKKNKLVNKVDQESTIYADPDVLKVIIRNLVTNANKFTREGEIIVTLNEEDAFYRICILDTGCGMPKEKIEGLFNWSSRQTTFGTLGEKGSGLGLLICRQFAEQHGGRLDVASEEGKGTAVAVAIARKQFS